MVRELSQSNHVVRFEYLQTFSHLSYLRNKLNLPHLWWCMLMVHIIPDSWSNKSTRSQIFQRKSDFSGLELSHCWPSRQALRTSSLKINPRSQAGKTSPPQHVHIHNLLAEEVHYGMKWCYNNEKAPRRLLIRFKLEPSKHCDYNCSSKLNIMNISLNTHLCILIQITAIVPLTLSQTEGNQDLSVWCWRHQCVCTQIPKWFTA